MEYRDTSDYSTTTNVELSEEYVGSEVEIPCEGCTTDYDICLVHLCLEDFYDIPLSMAKTACVTTNPANDTTNTATSHEKSNTISFRLFVLPSSSCTISYHRNATSVKMLGTTE